MGKLEPVILAETRYIFAVTLTLTGLMQVVFLLLNRWDHTILLGGALGACAAAGNFLLMGLTIQSAFDREEQEAPRLIRMSQLLRLGLLFAVALLGSLVPVFSTPAVVIPYLFPRIAIALRPLLRREEGDHAD